MAAACQCLEPGHKAAWLLREIAAAQSRPAGDECGFVLLDFHGGIIVR
jgi:hypothetical protein